VTGGVGKKAALQWTQAGGEGGWSARREGRGSEEEVMSAPPLGAGCQWEVGQTPQDQYVHVVGSGSGSGSEK